MFYIVLNFKECSYLCNQMSDSDGFGSKCSILNGQVIYIEKSKLNIADMWPISLDHVTNVCKKIMTVFNPNLPDPVNLNPFGMKRYSIFAINLLNIHDMICIWFAYVDFWIKLRHSSFQWYMICLDSQQC